MDSAKPLVTPDDFDLVAVAGRGAFGTVWVVRKKHDYSGRIMAMKALSKQDMLEREYVEHTVLEKEIMAIIGDHPFCVTLFFTFQTETHLYIVMEYLPGGHLLSYVMDSDDGWGDEKAAFYGGEVLLALEHMHEHNVVYRDLKLENILLDMDGHIRLTDFGLSALLKEKSDRVHSMSGTAAYIAPEVLNAEVGHSFSADLWSFGVMMFILLLHESPFYAENTNELFELIRSQEIAWKDFEAELSPNALSLLKGLLTKKVEDRLGCGQEGIAEVKRHPFFGHIDWESMLRMEIKPHIPPILRVAERATPEEFKREIDAADSVKGEDPFGGFSFVASDYLTLLQEDTTSHNSVAEEEESVCWPFPVKLLPISVVHNIIGYLSIDDVAVAAFVCKDWNRLLWSRLQEMDFSTVDPGLFSKHWTSKICPLLSRPDHLRSLTLNQGLKDAGISKLPQIISLERLSLSGCTNLSAHAIQRLHRTVQVLGFGFGKKEKEKKKEKASQFGTQRFPFLSDLVLRGCPNIGDGGLEHVVNCNSLKRLDLSGVTSMTDNGLQYVGLLKKLEVLNLSGVENITDAGLSHLHQLTSLREVDLGGTSVTDAGVAALQESSKGLLVKYSDYTADQSKKKGKKKQKFGLAFMREVSLSKKPKRGAHKRSTSVEINPGTFDPEFLKADADKKKGKQKKTPAPSEALSPRESRRKKKNRSRKESDADESQPASTSSSKSKVSPSDAEKKGKSRLQYSEAGGEDEKRARKKEKKDKEELRKRERREKSIRDEETDDTAAASPITDNSRDGEDEAAKRAEKEERKRETDRKAQEAAAEAKAREEAERLAQEEAARHTEEEAARRAQEEAARRAQEEAELEAEEEEQRKAQELRAEEEAAKRKQEAEEQKRKEEEIKKKREEELKKKREEELKKKREEDLKKKREEELKKKREEEEEELRRREEDHRREQEEAEAKAREAEAEKLRRANELQQKLREQIRSEKDEGPEEEPSANARNLWRERDKATSASLQPGPGSAAARSSAVSPRFSSVGNVERNKPGAATKAASTAKPATTAVAPATATAKAPLAATPKAPGTAKATPPRTAVATKARARVRVSSAVDIKASTDAASRSISPEKDAEESAQILLRSKPSRARHVARTGARRSVSDIASIFVQKETS